MNEKGVTLWIVCLFMCAMLSGCIGASNSDSSGEGAKEDSSAVSSAEESNVIKSFKILGRTENAEWDRNVKTILMETITDNNRAAPAQRSRTAEKVCLKLDGVPEGIEAEWDMDDGTREVGFEIVKSYDLPGIYNVTAMIGTATSGIQVIVNYRGLGSGAVDTTPGALYYEEGTGYFDYAFGISAGASVCEVNLGGTGEVDSLSDIDLSLLDPNGKILKTSTGEGCDERVKSTAVKVQGNYVARIGQHSDSPESFYISVGKVEYEFTIDILS